MSSLVILEWQFSPADYFEMPIQIARDDYRLAIDNGKVEARIGSEIYDAKPSIQKELHESLNSRFLGAQLVNHRAYELSQPSMIRLRADGRKDYYLNAEPGRLTLSGSPIDLTIGDSEGNVLADTKRERTEKKQNLAELVSKYRTSDQVLSSLLRSYDAAVRDPQNELVHLYEIRDTLVKRFSGGKPARSALSITSSDWNRLGQLCNDEPLRQGRHRGKSHGTLRDATEGELAEARLIATRMIEAYLRYLDNPIGPPSTCAP